MINEALGEMARKLEAFAAPLDPPPMHWIGEGDAGPDYCRECCERIVANHNAYSAPKDWWYVEGGWDCRRSSDTPSACEECGKTLGYSLTEYGVSEEIEHFLENMPTAPMGHEEAYALGAMLEGAAWHKDAEIVANAMKIGAAAISAMAEG